MFNASLRARLALLAAGPALLLSTLACTSHAPSPSSEGAAAEAPRAAGPHGIPMPTEHYLDEGAERDHKRSRKAWMLEMHRSAPETDWQAIERSNGEAEMERRRQLQTASSVQRWSEVGSRNQAGRMHCAVLGPDGIDGRKLYGGSALGGLWRAEPDGTQWEPLGDNLYGGVRKIVVLPGEFAGDPELLLVVTGPGDVRVTRDLGQSWETPAGSTWLGEVLETHKLDDAVNTILILARQSFSNKVFASTDYGRSFTQRWSSGQAWKGEMWGPRIGAEAATHVYLLHTGRLRRSTDGGQTFSVLSTLDASASEGRLCGSEAGAPTLYAALKVGGAWGIRRSDDGGLSWTSPTPMGDYWGALEASTIDALRVCYGGVEAFRSTDGAASFSKINTWSAYYGDPLHQLHADIQGIYCWPDPSDPMGWDLWYFCTDGGIFYSDDLTATVINRSLDGLGVSQYYTTHTSNVDTSLIVAGSQDQGYQRAVFMASGGPGPSTNFDQLISGDYGHLTSSDGSHDLLYSTYPGFILVQEGEQNPSLLYPFVDFPAGSDPIDKNSFFFLGDRLWRYTRSSGPVWNDVLHSTQTFTGGGGSYLSALAFAPSNSNRVYAVNDNGLMYRSLDHGQTWSVGAMTGTDSHYFYGSAIAVNPNDELEAFVGGAGYSNPAVWRTTDGGLSWAAESSGLPLTLVYDLAFAADGSGDVFAAAESGVFRWVRATQTWVNELDPGTPITLYWSVEAVAGEPTMRFGTYGRGIWDLDLSPLGCGTWEVYGVGASVVNFLALDSQTPPNIGAPLDMTVNGAGGAGVGYVMAGRFAGNQPLFGGVQLVDQVVRTFPLVYDSAGNANLHLNLPYNPAWVGLEFYFQAVAPDSFFPQGWALSNGLKMTIGL
jgi:photosystem II stability/assembly factor-like uncharacterized protein